MRDIGMCLFCWRAKEIPLFVIPLEFNVNAFIWEGQVVITSPARATFAIFMNTGYCNGIENGAQI